MPQPGEVVLIPFPYTNLAASKRRPVLVLRPADTFGDFLAVAVTSQAGHQDAVPLLQADFREGVLPKPSYFGALTPEAFARAHAAICTALDCQR